MSRPIIIEVARRQIQMKMSQLLKTALFRKMIAGEASDEEIDELEEAGALQSISKMPARVKCALLSWNTLEKLIDEK